MILRASSNRPELCNHPAGSLKLVPTQLWAILTRQSPNDNIKRSERDFIASLSKPKRRRLDDRFSRLPIELLQHILSYFDWISLWQFRAINKQMYKIVLSHPTGFSTIDLAEFISRFALFSIYDALSSLPDSLKAYVLPLCKDLSLSKINLASSDLTALLSTVSFRKLTTLNLSFNPSADTNLLLALLNNDVCLKKLNLKGCVGITNGSALARATPHLTWLDLSWTRLQTLPSNKSMLKELSISSSVWSGSDETLVEEDTAQQVWPNLQYLSISSCMHLPFSEISSFLADSLPSDLESIDLSYLAPFQLPLATLYHLKITQPSPTHLLKEIPTNLTQINLKGHDDLTRRSISELAAHWAIQRPDHPIKITHNDLILEEHSESAYLAYLRVVSNANVVL